MTRSLQLAAFTLLCAAGAALAASDPPTSSAPPDAVLEKSQAAIAKQDWALAAAVLRDGLAAKPGNAEYHNRYAYALRKGPNPDMGTVFKHYTEALRLDPEHRGAHEYIGEAYLMVGDLARAKAHLARLDRLCLFGCDEYDMLKKAVAAYEAKQKK